MDYQHLLSRLHGHAPFAHREDAEPALVTTLETLAYLLPDGLVARLREALPAECEPSLTLGLTLRRSRSRSSAVRAAPGRALGSLPPFTIERIQQVCAVLGDMLDPALTEDITSELPEQLLGAFEPRQSVPWKRGADASAAGDPAATLPSLADVSSLGGPVAVKHLDGVVTPGQGLAGHRLSVVFGQTAESENRDTPNPSAVSS